MFLNRHRIDFTSKWAAKCKFVPTLMKSLDVCKTYMMKEIMCTFNHEIINFEWHIKLEDFVIKCAHNFFHHVSFTNI